MTNQPANSPDLNILDLGFFDSIQSLQAETCARNEDELIAAVTEAYKNLNSNSLQYNFITLQSVMREILSHEGGNNYQIPHLDKSGHRRRGTEITGLHCPVDIYTSAKKFIESKEEQ